MEISIFKHKQRYNAREIKLKTLHDQQIEDKEKHMQLKHAKELTCMAEESHKVTENSVQKNVKRNLKDTANNMLIN